MSKRITILFCFAICLNNVFGQAVKYSNEFLSIGVGARAMGMGSAHVSITDDATSAYWNPAGLMSIKSNIQIAAMHSEYFAGIAKFDYATVASRINETTVVAGTLIRLGIDDIPNTLDLVGPDNSIRYDLLKSFSVADYAFMFSFAKESEALEGLRYAGNAKVIYRNVGEFANAYGFGIDLGAQYIQEKYTVGVMLRDVTGTFNAWRFNTASFEDVFRATNNEIPTNSIEVTLPKMIIGGGYTLNFNEKISLLGAADFDFTFDGKRNVLVKTSVGSIDPHFGLEAGYDKTIYLRAGLSDFQNVLGVDGKNQMIMMPSLGAGIRLKRIGLDYALRKGSESIGSPYSHFISLKLDIVKH